MRTRKVKTFIDENNFALFDIVITMSNCRSCSNNDVSEKHLKKGEKIKDLGGWCEFCYNDIVKPSLRADNNKKK